MAISSLFSHANAEIDNLDLKNVSKDEIQEIKTAFKQENDISYCKIKSRGLVCKDTNNSISVYPTESLEKIGISDDITEIVFLDGYKNPEKLSGVIFSYKNGSKKSLTYKVGEKYGYESKLDEYDTEISKKMIKQSIIEEKVSSLYYMLVKAVDKPNKEEELEQRIIKKYTGKDTERYKTYKKTQFNDDSLNTDDNIKLNNIMAKYQK